MHLALDEQLPALRVTLLGAQGNATIVAHKVSGGRGDRVIQEVGRELAVDRVGGVDEHAGPFRCQVHGRILFGCPDKTPTEQSV